MGTTNFGPIVGCWQMTEAYDIDDPGKPGKSYPWGKPPLGYWVYDPVGNFALQYGNAFGRGFQAAALKPADFFGDDDVLYLMEDMATGEIRLSILWEWLHKGARLTAGDAETGAREGDVFGAPLFARLLEEEHAKLLAARDRDVHDDSKTTTLPIAREIVATYVASATKPPWYIDLLNLVLDNHDLAVARQRIARYLEAYERDGTRITENLDFAA